MIPTRTRTPRIAVLGGVALASAGGFAGIARASATRAAARVDQRVRERARLPKRHPVRRASEAVAPLGKWWAYLPIAAGAGTWLVASARGSRVRRRRAGAAATILAAGLLATALAPLFDELLPQPPAPPGRRNRRKPVFPSGHAFGPAAVATTTAYLAAREGLARPRIAAPAAAMLPMLTVAGKLAGQKHWASDVFGGWLAGGALAAGCLAAYEALRER